MDYAGFGIPKKTFVLDVVEDEDGPVVVDYKDAKPTGLPLSLMKTSLEDPMKKLRQGLRQ